MTFSQRLLYWRLSVQVWARSIKDRFTQRCLQWLLKGKIEYLLRMQNFYLPDDADCRRNGLSADFYNGKIIGIDVSLKILGLVDFEPVEQRPLNTY